MKRGRSRSLVGTIEKEEIMSEERTVLARERTVLSFMQVGLASIGVGLVVINVFKESFGFMVLGGFLVLIGVVELIESLRRMLAQKNVMKRIKSREKKMGLFR